MLYTIVIPVYNVEAHLRKCVQSALSDPGGDYEVLLVDDGSSDSSGAICDEFARRDNRVRALHQLNAGVSVARNAGLEAASGKYVLFLDGDDYLLPAPFLRDYMKDDWDVTYFGFLYARGDAPAPEPAAPTPPSELSPEEVQRRTLYERFDRPDAFDFGSCCGRLYRRELIEANALRFEPGIRPGQDVLFNLRLTRFVKRARLAGRQLYCYLQHAGSTVHAYSPNICERVAKTQRALKSVVENEYASRADMLALMNCRTITDMTSCIRQNIASSANPDSREAREKAFRMLVAGEPFAGAIAACDPSLLSEANRELLKRARAGDLRAIERDLARAEAEERMRAIYMRLGLNKVKSFVKGALKR